MSRRVRARSSATRRGRIALTLLGLAALGAGSLTTAVPAAADTITLPFKPNGLWGIDYAGGVLTTVERAPNGDPYVTNRPVSADGTTAGDRDTRGYAGTFANGAHVQQVPCDAGACVPLRSAGNGDVGYFFGNAEGEEGKEKAQIWTSRNSYHSAAEPVVTGGRFVDITGRYYVYNAASTGKQYVDAVQPYLVHDVRLTRSVTAASVWGQRLYTPGSGNGTVTGYDLEQRRTVETLATGAPCTVKELQVVGRWVYWNCGATGPAGVYDRTAKRAITVPSGPALVGDGYLVRHDRTAGKLMLTDFHTGTAETAREIADLPAGNTADQRRQTWSVDKFGGDIAYADADGSVHVVQSGVPSQPLAVIESEVADGHVDVKDLWWNSTWQLNKPARWTFTVKDAQGRTVHTETGTGTAPEAGWNGKSDAGALLYNAAYSWTLTATATEGTGTYSTGGIIGLSGGLQGHHDQGGYSYGELVTLNSSGGLTLHYTKGKGTFDWKQSASGWPAGTVAVPFGDLTGDRCAEMLIRMPNGELRRYTGRCGVSYTPSNSRLTLGTGWNQYDVLTAPGDVTKDGRPDLIARNASTGAVYLYKGTSTGKLAARVKLYDNWKTYKKIVGAGDLNGDGIGDLVAQDKANNLYRYFGKGDGTFAPRVKIATGWGASYNAVVGIGDITGDGKADLVARDTAGNLFRQAGYGNGTFAARVKIGTGWQSYKGIF
ncbi:VCBS repeat-containing protein [Streptomyces yaanensis]|uniref:VCBS repeat-containing protein n=1 Tax=Streptomyces yaanensis TaxID=1142239 RepID=A0ABV7S929_9ACTN|nr:VCBS repeat-containing protein [Streptomyces sp. CGMCC 4.7035]WNC02786.1 VCBS repeat-containing protein [Streptomyces sp. CGMCC 4.7035]